MSKSYKIRNYDYVLLFMTIGIAVFGVFMIYSAGYYTAVLTGSQWRYVTQQVLGLGIGVVGMILVSGIDYRLFIKPIFGKKINFVYLVYLAAIIMQVAVLFVGVEKNGAKRWLNLGFVQFQPSEISKIAAILFVAYAIYRSRQSLDHFAGFLRVMLFMGPSIVLILVENMSSAIIVSGIVVGMCFVGSRKKLYFAVCLVLLICGGACYIGKQYINVGQNTLYLQKFNVTATKRYDHQYMANIEAPNNEATKTANAYGSDKDNTPIVFSIPVYNNMPVSACDIPSGGKNPNNYLKNLYVQGHAFSAPFALGDTGSKTYKTTVANKVKSVKVVASAVSTAATVTGTGSKRLSVGKNTIIVKVKSASGSTRSYKIVVTRKSAAKGAVNTEAVSKKQTKSGKTKKTSKKPHATKRPQVTKEPQAYDEDL